MTSSARSPYRFGDLLAFARRSWVEQVRSQVEEAGFPGYRQADAAVLRVLAPRPSPIGRLGEALGVTRQAARKLAGGMVERGYAAFRADPADARRTLVVLTEAGHAFGRAVAGAQDALNRAVQSRVSARDLAAADSVLRAVIPDGDGRRRVDGLVPPYPDRPEAGATGRRPQGRPAPPGSRSA